MTPSKSQNNGDEQKAEKVSHLLGEARMVLPGIQALFGFQLIAVFNQQFSKELTSGEQYLHLMAILLTVVAISLVMTPASYHRLAEKGEMSDRFIRISSRLLAMGMCPLLFGISIEIYLIA